MNPMLVIAAILAIFVLISVLLLDAVKPTFYKLDRKTRSAEKRAKKAGKIALKKLKEEVSTEYANKRIDEIEKSYLLRRIHHAESIVMTKLEHRDPRYKPGDDADLLK